MNNLSRIAFELHLKLAHTLRADLWNIEDACATLKAEKEEYAARNRQYKKFIRLFNNAHGHEVHPCELGTPCCLEMMTGLETTHTMGLGTTHTQEMSHKDVDTAYELEMTHIDSCCSEHEAHPILEGMHPPPQHSKNEALPPQQQSKNKIDKIH